MKKMMTIVVAALSIHSVFACEPYANFGTGPFLLMPNLGFGARFEDGTGKIDININHSFMKDFQTTQISMAKLFFSPNDLYIGPCYGLSFHKIKYLGKGSECTIGLVAGKQFDNHFIDMTYHRCIKWNKYKLDPSQVRLRFGVFF